MQPATVNRPDPKVLRRLASLLEEQLEINNRAAACLMRLNVLNANISVAMDALKAAEVKHAENMLELEAAAQALLAATLEEASLGKVTSKLIIDNVIVEVEVQFEVLTRHGNPLRSITAISIKRGNDRVDIVSQNSSTLVVYEDHELLIDVAIKTLTGTTFEDSLRFVMAHIERWTLEHRHDNHYDLVIKLLLKCKVIVHPEEKDVTPPPAPLPDVENQVPHTKQPHHSRTYIPHGTTFWRDGHYRTRNGVRHWVEGHWVTR